MSTLGRKLITDLRSILGQVIAITAVLGCGIATFVMSSSMIDSLESTRDNYYSAHRFADVFVSLTRAPKTLARRLEAIPGVAAVQTRIVRVGQVSMPKLVEPANLKILSIPERDSADVNRLYLRQGRFPEPTREREVVVAENFAVAHELRPGDKLDTLLDGRKLELTVVGIALSPEYVFAIEPGKFLPDDLRFGVVWMSERPLAAAFEMEGAFDDASLVLQPNASIPEVIYAVDRLTEPYGGTGAYGREDQESHRRLADEMLQLRSMASVSPFIFLIVAAFLFNIAVSRLIGSQRDEIATLRAFGYTRGEIGWHYLRFMLVLVLPGLCCGIAGGYALSLFMTELYAKFFRFPVFETQLSTSGTAIAISMSAMTCLIGGGGALRKAMNLQPAEAMRPPAPPSYRPGWIERIAGRIGMTPLAWMVLRRLRRSPTLTAMTITGIALSEAVLVMGAFVEDTVNYVMDVQFRLAQQQDATVVFRAARGSESLYDVRHLPGVVDVEGFRAVPVRLRHEHRTYRLAIQGLEARPRLYRVLDEHDQPIEIAAEGLTISEKLAEILELRIGDSVELEVLEESRPKRITVVAAIFRDYTEPGAYMRRESLQHLLRESERMSGAFVRVDPQRMLEFQKSVKQTPDIAAASMRDTMLESFRTTFAQNILVMRTVNLSFAIVISLGVIYNCARITLAERSRELATMRVLGFTRRETAWVLWGELGVLTTSAVPLGLFLGYRLCVLVSQNLDTETHRFPVIVTSATFAYAATVVAITALGSAWIVRRTLDRLDLIAVLKSRE